MESCDLLSSLGLSVTSLDILASWLVTGPKHLPIVELACTSGSCTCVFFLCMCRSSHCDGISVEDRSQGLNHILRLLKYSTSRAVSSRRAAGLCVLLGNRTLCLDPSSQQPFCSQSAPAEEGPPDVRLQRSLEGSVGAVPATFSCVTSREHCVLPVHSAVGTDAYLGMVTALSPGVLSSVTDWSI